jgi:hypothetical protein
MASYTIAARADQDGFEIEVIDHNGVHQTILGFKTQADAEAWIVRCARLRWEADPTGFRVQWRY